MQTSYTIGPRTFVLDADRACEALEAKSVVGGGETMAFNLLPLRYPWAYDLYRTMKATEPAPVAVLAEPTPSLVRGGSEDRLLDRGDAQRRGVRGLPVSAIVSP
jgi:hypothetical protein